MRKSIDKEAVVKLKQQVPQEVSARVGEEILKGEYEPSTWARALAKAQGDQEAVAAEYARLRISQLMRARTKAREKNDSLEQRRLNACLGVKTVKDILNGIGKVGVVNIPRPRVPWIWMLLLVLGVAGCFASFSRMLIGEIPDALRLWLPICSLGCGIAVVVVMVLSSQFFSRALVAWAWGPGIVGLSSVVCFGSLMLGAKLMVDNPFVQTARAEVRVESPSMADELGETAYWDQDNGLKAHSLVPVTIGISTTD